MMKSDNEFSAEVPIDLCDYLNANPIAYSAYRVFHNLSNNMGLSESDQIPFIKTPIYPFVLLSYIIFLRIIYFFNHIFGGNNRPQLPECAHIFILGTDKKYQKHALISIAESIEKEKKVAFLCSPAGHLKEDELDIINCETFKHTDLQKNVPWTSLAIFIFKAITIVRRTSDLSRFNSSFYSHIIAYNYLITEYVKTQSVNELMGNNPYVHTYAPMPYLIENTSKNKIFVYQHGVQWNKSKSEKNLMAVPFYIPLTYLVWGSAWIENFEDAAHPDSEIIPVGSPWHDHLEEKDSDRETVFDVLLLSQPYGNASDSSRYEPFIETIIQTCENYNLTLKIKLHPRESVSWYSERGWDSYVETFDDIDNALQQTRIAITHTSSAFVESSALGTPIVVADISDIGLRSLSPVQNVLFPKELDDIPEAMLDALNAELPDTERRVVMHKGATERILKVINSRRN